MPQSDFEPGIFLGYSLNMSEGGEPLVSALIDINKFDKLRGIVRAHFSWQNGVHYVGKISNMKFNRVMSQSYVLGSRGISHNRRDLDAVEKHQAAVSI